MKGKNRLAHSFLFIRFRCVPVLVQSSAPSWPGAFPRNGGGCGAEGSRTVAGTGGDDRAPSALWCLKPACLVGAVPRLPAREGMRGGRGRSRTPRSSRSGHCHFVALLLVTPCVARNALRRERVLLMSRQSVAPIALEFGESRAPAHNFYFRHQAPDCSPSSTYPLKRGVTIALPCS